VTEARRIVFAVCHADDEAVWIGALLHGLAQFDFLDVSVACFSGAGERSPEFEAARAVAGYDRGALLDLPLRSALEPLPPTGELLEQALGELELAPEAIDLLVTHAPYGDEHLNPHHRQAHVELRAWSERKSVPFGFFTTLPSPFALHRPLLTDLRRRGPLHLLQLARCRPTVQGRLLTRSWRPLGTARYFAQFLGDADSKRRMLECYRSVDQEEFRDGYAMYTSACESVYVLDERGGRVLREVHAAMDAPHPTDLFRDAGLAAGIELQARTRGARAKRLLRGV
jgi:hypothetical protein